MTFNSLPIPTKPGFEALLVEKAQEVASSAQSAEQAATNAANDANAQIAPNVAAAQTAETGAVTARDASEAARDQSQSARDAAIAGAEGVYATEAAGIAGTVDTERFVVANAEGWQLFENVSGTATARSGIFPSLESLVQNIVAEIENFGINRAGSYAFSLSDPFGQVLGGVTDDGDIQGLTIDGWSPDDLPFVKEPDWPFALSLVDPFGQVGFAVDFDEAFTGGGDAAQQVFTAWAEVWHDATRNLLVTWLSNSPRGNGLDYRVSGQTEWSRAEILTSRKVPFTEYYAHTSLIDFLAPDTVYEYQPAGSDYLDTVKTAATGTVKVAFASDYQKFQFGAGSDLAVLGSKIEADECDIVVGIGDYLQDDGTISALWGARWVQFMQGLAAFYRTRTGAQAPFIMGVGNHEGFNATYGAGGALAGGTGTLGYVRNLFVSSYYEGQTNRIGDGAAWYRASDDLMIIVLNAGHTVPIDEQRQWFQDLLTRMGAQFTHVIAVTHMGPLHVNEASPALIRDFWIPLQNCPTGRGFVFGHSHHLAVSKAAEFSHDAGASNANNALRFTTGDGLRAFGAGGWGGFGPDPKPTNADSVSSLDGTTIWDAAIWRDGIGGSVVTLGAIENYTSDYAHIWSFEFTASDYTASAISTQAGRTSFIEITETN